MMQINSKFILLIIFIICTSIIISGCALQTTTQSAQNTDGFVQTPKNTNQDAIEDNSEDNIEDDIFIKAPSRRLVQDDSDIEINYQDETTSTNTASEEQTIVLNDKDSNQKIALQKKPSIERQQFSSEYCDLDYPLNCVTFLAKNGIIYITLKNGHASKIENIELSLNSDLCDPKGAFMESGVLKEFECYVDSDSSDVQGSIEVQYYSVLDQHHIIKQGALYVLME